MSPEQCRGEPLDRRSDLFSLGIVLYELTTGKRLFKRDGVMSTLHAVCHDPIVGPREIDPRYPRALEALCARALVRDRRGRYATARDMRRDLVAAIGSMSGPGPNAGDAGDDEALGAVMSRLFADRIAEKRRMMHQVRSGSKVVHLALAEVDTQAEPPAVSLAERAGLVAARSGWPAHPAPPRIAQRALVIAGVAFIALVFRVAQRWGDADAPAPAPAQAEGIGPRGVAHAPAPAGPPPRTDRPGDERPGVGRPDHIALIVASTPPGASVILAGALRGRTPCSIEIPRSEAPITVVVARDGFPPVAERVIPGTDQRLVVHLAPSASKPKTRPRPTPPDLDTPAVFERFE
jgi:serine/threonine-protein kinase